jgi:CBS domain containing-hemolysin-like protein
MEIFLYTTIFLIFLASEAFFSGSEIALIAANPQKIRKSPNASPARIKMTLDLLKDRERILATTLCGTNLSVVTNSILITSFLLSQLNEKGEVYAVILLTPLLLIFGEIIPKTLFQQHANNISLRVAYPIFLASYMLYPLVFLITKGTQYLFRLSGAKGSQGIPFVTREELRLIVKMSRKGSDLTPEEVTMIDRLFDFAHTTVKEAMVPLVDVAAVEDTVTIKEVIELIDVKGHSRIPVFHERIDNIIGVINSFDLLDESLSKKPLLSLIRAVPYVPEVKPVDDLLIEMQKQRNHLAVVVDEYGGGVGIITIEDILEEIVGEIQDEYDRDQRLYHTIGKDKYMVSSRMEVDQIGELLSLILPEGDYETLGGFLLERFGHIPQPGEVLHFENVIFTVLSSDERSIGRVKIEIGGEE